MFGFIFLVIVGFAASCLLVRNLEPSNPPKPSPFVPTEELANLLKRLPLEERISYLGLSNVFQLYNDYRMCLTQEEIEWLANVIQEERNKQQASVQQVPYEYDNEPDDNPPQINWSRQKPIEYDEDDTYDNFYMQHEEEFKEMWGKDDYEDAIEDAWEEHQRDKELQKRWGK